MSRELRVTADGSHTLIDRELDEPYHSIHGAIQESSHVFINQGYREIRKSSIRILEIGLGTGLNCLLTLRESEEDGSEVYYYAVEKYPLLSAEFDKLNYEDLIQGLPVGVLQHLHKASWGTEFSLADNFKVFKEESDFRTMNPQGAFDLIYFDAFAPEKQPYLWTFDVFSKLFRQTKPGSILVSYTSKGTVRRALTSSGFKVLKVPGPPGKREMIRATRI